MRRKVGADPARNSHRDRLRMAAVDDGDMDPAFAGEFCGAEFRNHTTTAEFALAAALSFQRWSQFADHSLQARLFAAVRNEESVDVGEEQQPICLYCSGEQGTEFVVIAECAFK